jgi:DNA repair protein RadC
MAAYLLPGMGRAVEQFGIVLLDTKHRVIRIKVVSAVGSLDSTVVHPRSVPGSATWRGHHPVSQSSVGGCHAEPG